jgi:predicted ATP-grasp superfamily ATP-dependent carboligase
VLLCSRERDVLRSYYEFVMPDHKTVKNLLTKDGLSTVARECNIPAPQTVHDPSADTIEAIADGLAYPVLLKPAHSESWLRSEVVSLLRGSWLDGQAKVALCRDADELRQTYEAISVYDDNLIVQEMIPGPDHGLVYACFYLDRQSRALAFFAGRKLRVLPVGFGSASYVQSFRDPELEEITYKLLDCVGYQGLGGIEFKRDARDETYKLIEFNARFGLWDSLGIKCGVDIPHIAYRDALGQPITPQLNYREGVLWVDLQRDFRAFLRYRRRGELSFINWLRSLLGEKQWSTYDRDDWRPGLTEDLNLLRRQWKAIQRRLPYIGGK